jgi:hypothetical protein
LFGLRRLRGQARDQNVEGGDFLEVFRREPGDLREARVHGANAVLRVEEHHAFFQPLDDAE